MQETVGIVLNQVNIVKRPHHRSYSLPPLQAHNAAGRVMHRRLHIYQPAAAGLQVLRQRVGHHPFLITINRAEPVAQGLARQFKIIVGKSFNRYGMFPVLQNSKYAMARAVAAAGSSYIQLLMQRVRLQMQPGAQPLHGGRIRDHWRRV